MEQLLTEDQDYQFVMLLSNFQNQWFLVIFHSLSIGHDAVPPFPTYSWGLARKNGNTSRVELAPAWFSQLHGHRVLSGQVKFSVSRREQWALVLCSVGGSLGRKRVREQRLRSRWTRCGKLD